VLASSARSAKMRWLFCACYRQAVRLAYLLDRSRMSREVHVRFWERPGVKLPGPTLPPPLRATGCLKQPKSIMLRVAAWALAICAHTISLADPYVVHLPWTLRNSREGQVFEKHFADIESSA